MTIAINVIDEEFEEIFNNVEWDIFRPGLRKKLFIYKGMLFSKIEYFCQDCNEVSFKVFMVNDDVWNELDIDGFICLDCFEKKLGRKIKYKDLTNAPCNDYFKVRRYNYGYHQ